MSAEFRGENEYWQDYSVYEGRKRLGRVVRLEKRKYLAFDECDQILGSFCRLKPALVAISMAMEAPE